MIAQKCVNDHSLWGGLGPQISVCLCGIVLVCIFLPDGQSSSRGCVCALSEMMTDYEITQMY